MRSYGRFTMRQEVFHGGFTGGSHITSSSSLGPIGRNYHLEGTMDSSKNPNRTDLTPEQKAKIRNAGKDAEAVELSVEELEERIAPKKSL
jgi:hypothetical protein